MRAPPPALAPHKEFPFFYIYDFPKEALKMHLQKRLFSVLLPFLCLCAVVPALSSVAFAYYEVGSTFERTCNSGRAQCPYRPDRLHRIDAVSFPATSCNTSSGGGLYTITCLTCDYTSTVGLYLPHNFVNNGFDQPTCSSPGKEYLKCSVCSKSSSNPIPISPDAHTWVEVSRAAATCTAAGSVNYDCSSCHTTKSDPLPALGGDHT